MSSAVPFTEEDLHDLYMWVDEVPISRPKRNIARDFADGCCVAEILKYFFPLLVDLHNYSPAMSRAKKIDNWRTLNRNVLRKIRFEVPQAEMDDIVDAVPGAIERFLRALRIKVSQIKERREELQDLLTPRRASSNGGGGGVSAAAYGYRPASRGASSLPGAAAAAAAAAIVSPGRDFSPSASRPATTSQAMPRTPVGLRGAGPRLDHEQHVLLEEKDRTILELRETVGILSEKIRKLEELVRVKDEKLNQYRTKFGRM